MRAEVHSHQAGVAVEFEVSGLTSGPDGELYIDGSDGRGRLWTVRIGGKDLDGHTFAEIVGGKSEPPEGCPTSPTSS